MKIARVSTVPFFLYNHLRSQIIATIQAGHEVVLISSPGEEAAWLESISGVRFLAIDIPRKISPLRDFVALLRLYLLFKKEQFDIVHSTTPKAGMLCAIAGALSGVPVRLHTFTGQAWMEMNGTLRWISKMGDRLTAHLNTLVYADSFSQKKFMLSERICAEQRIKVLASGSLSGVDLSRFDPELWTQTKEATLRKLNIPPDHKVITFIGRLTKDKGIFELIKAFASLRQGGYKCTLLLIGPREGDEMYFTDKKLSDSESGIHFLGYSLHPEKYLAITDVFCLPSYREGFANVVIESAAMKVPTVGTDIVGLRDSVVNGETGILIPPKDPVELAKALGYILDNDHMRKEMGEKAQRRVNTEFSSERVNQAVLDEYEQHSVINGIHKFT